MQKVIIFFVVSFAISLVLSPLILKLLRKLKASQTVLHYVAQHKDKTGTPTMGGFIFILPMLVASFFLLRKANPLTNIVILASLGYAVLGFLDDFIKIKTKKNLGLRAYQKIAGQGGIAVLVSIFYYFANPDGRIFVPFLNTFWDIGLWIAPLTFFVLVATTNAVNLTDGIDGLAGSVSFIYLAFMAAIITLLAKIVPLPEANTLLAVLAVTCGGLLCFLLFNTHKAKIFMGDTGSLYLGSILALTSVFSFGAFFILFLGIMFVWSAVSVIIQVAYFKKTGGKRVFLMTPYHHHLEKRGLTEAKIVMIYCTITILAGALCVLSML